MIKAAFKYKGLMAVAVAYMAVRLPYVDFVPIWDGALAYSVLRHAFLDRLDLFQVEAHNHICFLYMYLMAIPVRLDLNSIVPLNLFLTVFTLSGIAAFYKILEFLIGKRVSEAELALMTAVFAFQPAVLASTLHLTLDPGVLTAFLFLLLAFLKESYGWAAMIGVFLIFTKETGLLLLPLAPILAFMCYPERRSAKAIKEAGAALFFPLILFGVYAFYKTQIIQRPLFWRQLGDNKALFFQLVDVFAFNRRLWVQLIQGFVLSFQWVLTVVLAVLVAVYLIKSRRASSQNERRNVLFSTGLFFVVLYLLTRFRIYSNPRYLLPFYAVFLILLFQLTALCIGNKYVRSSMALIYLALFIPSLYLTLDPVSVKLFGAFDFGKHKMLKMASLTKGEGSGFGRDQLVYNLQFLQFHYMQDYAYGQMKPGSDTVIITSSTLNYLWWFMSLKRDNYKRTVSEDASRVFWPKQCTLETFLKKEKNANEVYYFEYPNVNHQRELEILGGLFKKSETRVFERGGYELRVTRFHK